MVSKKTLGDLGWEVIADRDKIATFKKNKAMITVDRRNREIWLNDSSYVITFAEIAAILDFIVEDAIY